MNPATIQPDIDVEREAAIVEMLELAAARPLTATERRTLAILKSGRSRTPGRRKNGRGNHKPKREFCPGARGLPLALSIKIAAESLDVETEALADQEIARAAAEIRAARVQSPAPSPQPPDAQ